MGHAAGMARRSRGQILCTRSGKVHTPDQQADLNHGLPQQEADAAVNHVDGLLDAETA
jgi:hypothetical protein